MKFPEYGLMLFVIAVLAASGGDRVSADEMVNGVQILDRTHHSRVMGESRHYRIFLPPGYETDADRRYPVIYYFHGWSQRYFGSRPDGKQYEKGEDNAGDNFVNFVAKNPVIVVKWDGFNPRYPGEDYLRPYNISPVETHRQYPPYFPELVEHIDSHYRTIADRGHRGVTGLSMGGFMAFWVGGKYPDLVGSVGNFMGSDEFAIGPKDFPVEYKHADMYGNYNGRPVRHHMGSRDFIRGYHARMNRTWDFVMDHYEHQTYDSDHGSAGLGEMLAFHMKAFREPLPLTEIFNHIDVYPMFRVRGWEVSSDRHHPGFTVLERVGRDGFRSSVRMWLPDGPLMGWVGLTLTTDSIYTPGESYVVTDIDLTDGGLVKRVVRADADGRIVWTGDGSLHEVGITPERSGKPILSLAGTGWADKPWLEPGVSTGLHINIVNKGTKAANKVRIEVSPHRSDGPVEIKGGKISVGDIHPGNAGITGKAIGVLVKQDVADRIRLDLVLQDDAGNAWKCDFTLPVNRPGPEVSDFVVADGKTFTVLEHGNQLNRKFLGRGNGDGIPNPGETIVILVSDNDTLRMTEITCNDPYLNPFELAGRFSDNWGSFDHVGGSNKVSELLIASDCPSGRKISLHFTYLYPEYPAHFAKAGRVTITVRGKDSTPPGLDFVEATSDGRLIARLRDGGRIGPVAAEIRDSINLDRCYRLEMNDDGIGPDRVAGDLLFSALWRPVHDCPGTYRVKLKATDAAGNTAVLESGLK